MIIEIIKFVISFLKIFFRNLVKKVKINKIFLKKSYDSFFSEVNIDYIFITSIPNKNIEKQFEKYFLLNKNDLKELFLSSSELIKGENINENKNSGNFLNNYFKNNIEIFEKNIYSKKNVNNEDNLKNFIFSIKINPEKDKIYGLGLKFSSFNRKGKVFDNFNTDNFIHSFFSDHLYSTSNIFYITNDKYTLLFIIDYPGFIRYDFCKTYKDRINILIPFSYFNIYISYHKTLYEAILRLYKIQNTFYKPPFHAFGYTHSRWGIKSLKELKEIYNNHKKENIPLSNICLDIDYMEDYKNFTLSKYFGPKEDFINFVNDVNSSNTFIIPIIDAGIKESCFNENKFKNESINNINNNNYFNSLYNELINSNCLIRTENNTPFIGKVWPGNCFFLDFTNSKTQYLWKELIKKWSDFSNTYDCWLDMNEPSIFDSKNKTFPPKTFNSDNIEDKFIHNIYPYYQAKATLEAFLEKGKRPMLFSRSGYTFQGRYSGNWTGDNKSSYFHLKIGFQQINSLSICGTMYAGTDIGGFWGNMSKKLFIDWFKVCLFHPLFRNHSSMFSKRREVYLFDNETKNKIKDIINTRYKLLPQIYSSYMTSTFFKVPYILPILAIENINFELNNFLSKLNLKEKHKIKNKKLEEILENIILVGETILYDPFNYFDKYNIIKEFFLREKNYKEFSIDNIKIYLKEGKGIILTEEIKLNRNIFEYKNLYIIGNPDKNNSFEMFIYLDDGITRESIEKFSIYNLKIIIDNKNNIKNYEIKTIFENLENSFIKLKDSLINNLLNNVKIP